MYRQAMAFPGEHRLACLAPSPFFNCVAESLDMGGTGGGADEEIVGEGRNVGNADEADILAHFGVERLCRKRGHFFCTEHGFMFLSDLYRDPPRPYRPGRGLHWNPGSPAPAVPPVFPCRQDLPIPPTAPHLPAFRLRVRLFLIGIRLIWRDDVQTAGGQSARHRD